MTYKYSHQSQNVEHAAKAVGRALPISTKVSIEICNTIRKRQVKSAKKILEDTILLRKPIPFKRFTNGLGHKKGIASGRYPKKAAEEILKLLENVEANAQFKGLNTSELIITHISAHKGGNVWRYGRYRRRKMKRTNIEVVVEEKKSSNKHETKKEISKQEPKESSDNQLKEANK